MPPVAYRQTQDIREHGMDDSKIVCLCVCVIIAADCCEQTIIILFQQGEHEGRRRERVREVTGLLLA